MIDTIKLVMKNQPPPASANFQPNPAAMQPGYRGYFWGVSNPTAEAKRLGTYQPRLTFTQRPTKHGVAVNQELQIEMSLPKLVYGNNFDELQERDFPATLQALKLTLRDMGAWFFSQQLQEAEVRAIHYSKNIVFRDYTSCSSILKMLHSADISRVYDVQKTDFRNGGHIFHVKTNSLDVAFYDKLADLRRAQISDKRAYEDDNIVQLSLFDELQRRKPLAVLRYEVRLNGKAKIRQVLLQLGITADLTFEQLFSESIAKQVLRYHWKNFFDRIPKLPLDTKEPEKLLANILKEPDLTGSQQAAARLGMLLTAEQSDVRYVKKLFDDRFGRHAWSGLKQLLRPVQKVQYKSLLEVDQALADFKPTRFSEISG